MGEYGPLKYQFMKLRFKLPRFVELFISYTITIEINKFHVAINEEIQLTAEVKGSILPPHPQANIYGGVHITPGVHIPQRYPNLVFLIIYLINVSFC